MVETAPGALLNATSDPTSLTSLAPNHSDGVVYLMEWDNGGARWQVRAAVRPGEGSDAALFSCDSECTLVAPLNGGVGTTGEEVLAAVPLALADLSPGVSLREIRAVAATGTVAEGPLQELHELSLADAEVLEPLLFLGWARAGTDTDEMDFAVAVSATNGRFSTELPIPERPGLYEVWAAGCLGDICGVALAEETVRCSAVRCWIVPRGGPGP